MTVDLHCGQIQGFFHQTPVDNLFAENEFVKYIEHKHFDKDKVIYIFISLKIYDFFKN